MLNKLKKTTNTLSIPEKTILDPIAPKGIISYVARVSPSDANYLLQQNENNRYPSEDIVKKYKRDMEEGVWQDSASQIQISKQGKLLNGQHRLRAIVESNTSQILTITEGLTKECFQVIDVGKGRNAADALGILKIKNFSNAASMIRFYIVWREGFTPYDMQRDTSTERSYNQKGVSSNQGLRKKSKAHQIKDILEFALDRPNVEHLATISKNAARKFKPFAPSIYGAFLLQADALGHSTRTMAEDFLEKVGTGAGLHEDDPILVMREKITTWIQEREWTHMGVGYKMQVLVVTWNHWINGTPLNKKTGLRVSPKNPVDMVPVEEMRQKTG